MMWSRISRKALEHGSDMAKDMVIDMLHGKSLSEAGENQIEIAKKKVGRRHQWERACCKKKEATRTTSTLFNEKKKCFNLLD